MNGQITQVSLGNLTIDAVIDGQCNYYVTVQSIARLFQLRQNNATRDLKAILGEQYSLLKITVKNDGANRSQNNCIALRDFETVALQLAISGNPIAAQWVRALVGLSLTQLCADAFGVKFEASDRQAWLKNRLTGKVARRSFTDALRDWLAENQVPQSQHVKYYAGCTNLLYKEVLGMTAANLVIARGCAPKDLRNNLTQQELAVVERIEDNAAMLVDRGLDPMTAMTDSISYWQRRR